MKRFLVIPVLLVAGVVSLQARQQRPAGQTLPVGQTGGTAQKASEQPLSAQAPPVGQTAPSGQTPVGQTAPSGQTPTAQVPPAGQPPPAGQTPPSGQAPQQAPAQPLAPTEWRIDSSHSQANFSVKHNVVSTVRGQLGPISGKLFYDGKDIRTIAADVRIDVTKINTQNERRDNHLRQDDFFNVEKFPALSFKSKRVEPGSEGRFRLVGDLTIRDKTHEIALDVEGPAPVVKGPRGVITGATATTRISRKQFGVLWNRMIEAMPVVGDEVQVTIDMQLTRPELPGGTTAAR